MRWRVLGGLSLSLLGLVAVGFAAVGVPTSPGPRPVLGFDDSPDPEPTAGRPALGFEDTPAPIPTHLPDPAAYLQPQAVPPPVTQVAYPVRPSAPPCGPCLPPDGDRCWETDDHLPVWFEGDLLLWWIKESRVPPLVSTSPQTSLGVLGRPGTQVLLGGDLDNEERLGGRFRLGAWLDDDWTWGVETDFFFLGERSVNYAAGSAGSPLLARPFFNAFTGSEDAEFVANLPVPSLPLLLPLTGRVSVASSSRMWGLEGNGIYRLAGDDGSNIGLLAGFRYLRLDEGLAIGEDLLVPAGSPAAAGLGIQVQDDFATRNNFYGGQLGLRGEVIRGAWSLDLLGKLALGDMQQLTDIKGATRIQPAGGTGATFAGGLLALPTNIGRSSRDRFAVLPEVGANVAYRVTDGLRVRVGYTFLYASSVARPGDQIDRSVNPTQLPPGTLRGPAVPAFVFHGTDFWAQGLNFGVEYAY
jgi:hypothetical protein